MRPRQAACRRHDEHGKQEDQHKQLYITVVPWKDALTDRGSRQRRRLFAGMHDERPTLENPVADCIQSFGRAGKEMSKAVQLEPVDRISRLRVDETEGIMRLKKKW